MASATEVERPGTIALVVTITIAASLLLAIIVVSIVLLIRRRRAALHRRRHGVAILHPAKEHKNDVSDSSANALLLHGQHQRWDPEEKYHSPDWPHPMDDEITHDAVISHSVGYHYLPEHPPTPSSATMPITPSHRSSYFLDANPAHHYHLQAAQANRPPPPSLPPLVIPSDRPLYTHGLTPTTISEESYEELSPTQPPSSSPSSASLYSQSTAEPSLNTPSVTFYPLPMSQEPEEHTDNALKRGETRLVGNLLKARAKRNPDGLVREASQVSRIERMGSIRSVGSIHEDDRPFPNRYRAKKQKVHRTMDSVRESSVIDDTRSFRSPRPASSMYDESLTPVGVPIPDVPSFPPLLFTRVEPLSVAHDSSPNTVPLRIEPKRRVR